ncbi:MAG: hypothetical protein KME30_07705 [Iphinoe sp. HA4291-MV1]|nr:hypothetical protein [Iphinoe sp. HA4291-MV1]
MREKGAMGNGQWAIPLLLSETLRVGVACPQDLRLIQNSLIQNSRIKNPISNFRCPMPDAHCPIPQII